LQREQSLRPGIVNDSDQPTTDFPKPVTSQVNPRKESNMPLANVTARVVHQDTNYC